MSATPEMKDAGREIPIYTVQRLAVILGISKASLVLLADNSQTFYREFHLEVKGKSRTLIEATGPLKAVHRRILDRILLRIVPFERSFGAVKGRSTKSNADLHRRSPFIVKMDIKDFYPSVRFDKVYGFFANIGCTPDVARLLTKLTTRNHSLPLGASTSPFLADQIIRGIDTRIDAMAKRHGIKYSRYVDDIALSARFQIKRFSSTVAKILRQNGFRIKASKLIVYGPGFLGEKTITGVRVNDGRLTAPTSFVKELEDDLRSAAIESRKNKPAKVFMPREHYFGRVGYVLWLDEPLGQRLLRLYRKVKWRHLEWASKQPPSS